MQLLEYKNSRNVIVQFLDEYKCTVRTQYKTFENGKTRNPYFPTVCGVGIIGNKHKVPSKEYYTWADMIKRCYSKKIKESNRAYKDVTCCKEWLLFDNFYDWLHSQENFDNWFNGDKWTVDKDILKKHNKVYCSENCCLVSNKVNCLFERNKFSRNNLPIGVCYHKESNKYQANCKNSEGKNIYLGIYEDVYDAFNAYKIQKEKIIKQVAKKEYEKGNIIEKCYKAMINYEVEIYD